MGRESSFQPKLFYHQINGEERVPKSTILRKIQKQIDFDFIYDEVKLPVPAYRQAGTGRGFPARHLIYIAPLPAYR